MRPTHTDINLPESVEKFDDKPLGSQRFRIRKWNWRDLLALVLVIGIVYGNESLNASVIDAAEPRRPLSADVVVVNYLSHCVDVSGSILCDHPTRNPTLLIESNLFIEGLRGELSGR